MIRLYGVGRGQASWARVTAGIRGALEERDLLAGFFEIGNIDDDLDDSLGAGYNAPIGLCIGPPTAAQLMVGHGDHKHRLLMIATNSSWLPDVIMERAAKLVTAFIGTSTWASSVIEKYARERPVYTWPHGVERAFEVGPAPLSDTFTALHLASTHLQRKATAELIFGWAEAVRDGGVKGKLRMVVDGPRGYFLQPIHGATEGDAELADTYELTTRLGLSVEKMAEYYSQHYLVCQPSRAEGFGLVPIEARACGVPVLATACTGHADHFTEGPGLVIVPNGADEPVNDGPGAMAPSVDPFDIAEALCRAYRSRGSLLAEARAEAAAFSDFWSWSAVTERFLDKHGKEIGLK
jgi:hypothetical protein